MCVGHTISGAVSAYGVVRSCFEFSSCEQYAYMCPSNYWSLEDHLPCSVCVDMRGTEDVVFMKDLTMVARHAVSLSLAD